MITGQFLQSTTYLSVYESYIFVVISSNNVFYNFSSVVKKLPHFDKFFIQENYKIVPSDLIRTFYQTKTKLSFAIF